MGMKFKDTDPFPVNINCPLTFMFIKVKDKKE